MHILEVLFLLPAVDTFYSEMMKRSIATLSFVQIHACFCIVNAYYSNRFLSRTLLFYTHGLRQAEIST